MTKNMADKVYVKRLRSLTVSWGQLTFKKSTLGVVSRQKENVSLDPLFYLNSMHSWGPAQIEWHSDVYPNYFMGFLYP